MQAVDGCHIITFVSAWYGPVSFGEVVGCLCAECSALWVHVPPSNPLKCRRMQVSNTTFVLVSLQVVGVPEFLASSFTERLPFYVEVEVRHRFF